MSMIVVDCLRSAYTLVLWLGLGCDTQNVHMMYAHK